MWLIITLVTLVIISIILYFKRDKVIRFIKKYKKKLLALFITTSTVVGGGGLIISTMDDGVLPTSVEALILIESIQDYAKYGYDISRIVNPIVYERQVLTEGNMPIVYQFKMNDDMQLNRNQANNLVTSYEVGKQGFDGIEYTYQILINETFYRNIPVYKDVEYTYEVPVEQNQSLFDIIKQIDNQTKTITETIQELDYYEQVEDYRYVWKDIKDLSELRLKNDKVYIINIKGRWNAEIGSRQVDVVPQINIDTNTYTFSEFAWWESNWNYRKEITLNSSQVPSTQINFPVCINITDTDLKEYAQSSGNDIAFTNTTGTKLNHEIELYDNITGRLVAWVNVTELKHDVDTTTYMYYGNANAANQQNVGGTWDSNFAFVSHMHVSSGNLSDSTGNHVFTVTNEDKIIYQVTGRVGYGIDMNNSGYFSKSAAFCSHTLGTVSAWVTRDSTNTASDGVFGAFASINDFIGIQLRPSSDDVYSKRINRLGRTGGIWRYHVTGDEFDVTSSSRQVVLQVDGSGNRYYVDGALGATSNVVFGSVSNTQWFSSIVGTPLYYIGAWRYDAIYPLDGIVEEFRVSTISRSADWINTEYNSIVNATDGGFFSLGEQQSQDVEIVPIILSNPNPVNNSIDVSIALSEWCIDIAHLDGDSMDYTIECSSEDTTSDTGVYNDTYCLTFGDILDEDTQYTVWVNVTDGVHTVNAVYYFTTETIIYPQSPIDFDVTAIGRFRIDLTWTKGDDATHTYIRYAEGGFAPADRDSGIFLYNGTGESTYIDTLDLETQYSFSAWSYNDEYNTWSDLVFDSATTDANTAPSIDDENPEHDSIDIDKLQSTVSVDIEDIDGDLMDWTIEGQYVVNDGDTGVGNIKISADLITPLPYDTLITWYVNVTDSYDWTREVFTFTVRSEYIPDDPIDFTATADGRFKIDLSWTKGSNVDYTYICYAEGDTSPVDRDSGIFLYNDTGESTFVDELKSGTEYSFSAWSYNVADNTWSDRETDSETTDYSPPDTPDDFTATAIDIDRIDLSWDRGVNATHTYIEYLDEHDYSTPWDRGDGNEIYNNTGESYSHTDLDTDIHYYYQTWSYSDTTGLWSITYVSDDARTYMDEADEPDNFVALTSGRRTISLSWDRGVNSSHTYIEYLDEDSYSAPWTRGDGIEIYNDTGESFIHKGLKQDTVYYYQAWGWNPRGYSDLFVSSDNITLISAAWHLMEWTHRYEFVFNYLMIPSAQYNIPIAINITDIELATYAQSNGNDIIFVDLFGNQLDHEIEYYNSTTGRLVAWVNVNELKHDDITVIYMYYGNPESPNQQNVLGTWDSNFKAVWHMHDSPTGVISDSTPNNNHLTPFGDMTADNFVDGYLGKAIQLDGVDDYLRGANTASLRPSSVTMVALLRQNVGRKSYWTIGKQCEDQWGNTDAVSYGLGQDSDGVWWGGFERSDNSNTNPSKENDFLLENWYHVAITHNGVDTANIYVNGEVGDPPIQGVQALRYVGATYFLVGAGKTGGTTGINQWHDMVVDELWVYGGVLSADTIKTLSNSKLHAHNGGFYNYDPERIPIYNEYPANESIDVILKPLCSVEVEDEYGLLFDVIFESNYTGDWAIYQVNTSVGNGTYTWDFDEVTDTDITYYWRVWKDNGITNVSGGIYHFTTGLDPHSVNESPKHEHTWVDLQPTVSVYTDGNVYFEKVDVVISSNYTGTWIEYKTETVNMGEQVSWYFSGATDYRTQYWWRAEVKNETYSTVTTYSFITKEDLNEWRFYRELEVCNNDVGLLTFEVGYDEIYGEELHCNGNVHVNFTDLRFYYDDTTDNIIFQINHYTEGLYVNVTLFLEERIRTNPIIRMWYGLHYETDTIAIDDIFEMYNEYIDEHYILGVFTDVGSDSFEIQSEVDKVDILVVAGGGGAGRGATFAGQTHGAGAGGAGGLIFIPGVTVESEDWKNYITPTRNIMFTIGDGGAAGSGEQGKSKGHDGGDSIFGNLTAKGGGGGGSTRENWASHRDGRDGGSGGGGGIAQIFTWYVGGRGDETQSLQSDWSSEFGYGTMGGGLGSPGASGNPGGGGGALTEGSRPSGGSGLDLSRYFGTLYGDNGVFSSGGNAHSDGSDGLSNTGAGGNARPINNNAIGGAGGSGIIILKEHHNIDQYICVIGDEMDTKGVNIIPGSERPLDNAVGTELNTSLRIQIDHPHERVCVIKFRTNASGSWETIDSVSGIISGIVQVSTSDLFTDYDTKYYWSVNVSEQEGIKYWVNKSFSFTTLYDTTYYNYMVEIKVDSTRLSDDISNFVLPLRIHQTITEHCDDGDSILFTNMNDGKFPHSVDIFSTDTLSFVHVKILDTLKTTSLYTFRMYFNNSLAVNQEDKVGTWSDYTMVYHLSEESGDLIDSTMNGYDVVPANSPSYKEGGIFGYAMEFDGTNQYAAIKDKFYETYSLNEMLVYTLVRTDSEDEGRIFSFGADEYYDLAMDEDGYGTWTIQGDKIDSEDLINENEWVSVSGIFDKGQYKIYVNDEVSDSGNRVNTFGSEDKRYGFIGIGSSATSFNGSKTGSYFEGRIDEVLVRENIPINVDSYIAAKHYAYTDTTFVIGVDEPWGGCHLVYVSLDNKSHVPYGEKLTLEITDDRNDFVDIDIFLNISGDLSKEYTIPTLATPANISVLDFVTRDKWITLDYNTKYEFVINVTNTHGLYVNNTYNFTTAHTSSIESYSILNETMDVNYQPTLMINLTSESNISRTVEFYTNITGDWIEMDVIDITLDQTADCIYQEAYLTDTTYWWKVIVEEGYGNYSSDIYHFTITSPPSIVDINPVDNEIDIGYRPTVFVNITSSHNNTARLRFYENHTTGDWVLRYTEYGIHNDNTATWAFEQVEVMNQTYWWKVIIDVGYIDDAREYVFNFTTEDTPKIQLIYPLHEQSDIERHPACKVKIIDTHERDMDVTFYSYIDGDYWLSQINYSELDDSIVEWKYIDADLQNTTYKWKVNVRVNDSGLLGYIEYEYEFATAKQPIIVSYSPEDDDEYWSEHPVFNIEVNDPLGHTMDISLYENTSLIYTYELFNQTQDVYNGSYLFDNTTWMTDKYQEHTYMIAVNNSKGFWTNETVSFKYGRVSIPLFATYYPIIDEPIHFIDISTNATQWNWTIHHTYGTYKTTEQNPSFTYEYMGNYTVILKINEDYTYWQTNELIGYVYVGYNQTIQVGEHYFPWMGNETTLENIKNYIRVTAHNWTIKHTEDYPRLEWEDAIYWVNTCPIGYMAHPFDGQQLVSIYVSRFSIAIYDADGNYTSGWINCSNGDKMSWTNQPNGIRSLWFTSLLDYDTDYTVTVEFTDGHCYVAKTYKFKTTPGGI